MLLYGYVTAYILTIKRHLVCLQYSAIMNKHWYISFSVPKLPNNLGKYIGVITVLFGKSVFSFVRKGQLGFQSRYNIGIPTST